MSRLEAATSALRAAGLLDDPPHVLVSRWIALLAGDDPHYLDAAHDSGRDVPGARYTFLAITDTAVCYLSADHEDEFWSQDHIVFRQRQADITPRTLVAWRRPLAQVTEIGLGGDAWQWLPQPGSSHPPPPAYTITVGDSTIDLPLRSRRRAHLATDPTAVVGCLTRTWRQCVSASPAINDQEPEST